MTAHTHMLLFAIACSACWAGVAWHFAGEYRRRHNPLSSAIVGHVVATMYVGPYLAWNGDRKATIAISLLSLLVCLTYYAARFAARRYPDQRKAP